MWKWSLSIGRIAGTEVHLHISCLLAAPSILYLAAHAQAEGAFLAGLAVLFVLWLASIALHELGHATVARRCNASVERIVLWPLGGLTLFERPVEQPRHDVLISLAGPLVNLALCGLLWPLAGWAAGRLGANAGASEPLIWVIAAMIVYVLLILNASLVIFNLLPIYPLDGGRILHGLVLLRGSEQRAKSITLIVSLPLALGLLVLGLRAGDPLMVAVAPLLMLVALGALSPRFGAAADGALDRVRAPGDYFYARQDYEPAVEHYARAIHRGGNTFYALLGRGICYEQLGDFERAFADFEHAIQLDPRASIAYFNRGLAHHVRGNYAQALRDYDRALALEQPWPGLTRLAYRYRARLHQALGDYASALADIELAMTQSPTGGLLAVRSSILYASGEHEQARADLERAIQHVDVATMIHDNLSLVVAAQGDLAGALRCYDRIVERWPVAWQPYRGRGDVYRIHDLPAQALTDYDRALTLAPREGELYLLRGRCAAACGMTDQAAGNFKQALRLLRKRHLRRQATEELRLLRERSSEPHVVAPAA